MIYHYDTGHTNDHISYTTPQNNNHISICHKRLDLQHSANSRKPLPDGYQIILQDILDYYQTKPEMAAHNSLYNFAELAVVIVYHVYIYHITERHVRIYNFSTGIERFIPITEYTHIKDYL